MPSQRVPGPLGLSQDERGPLPTPGRRWEPRGAIPSGAGADAKQPCYPVGLGPEDFATRRAERSASKPVERTRFMEIQGEIYKVRWAPPWQARVNAMLAGSDDDDKVLEKLLKTIRDRHGDRRTEMVSHCTSTLEAQGRGSGRTSARLARFRAKESAADDTQDGPDESRTSEGRLVNG